MMAKTLAKLKGGYKIQRRCQRTGCGKVFNYSGKLSRIKEYCPGCEEELYTERKLKMVRS